MHTSEQALPTLRSLSGMQARLVAAKAGFTLRERTDIVCETQNPNP